MNAILLIFVIDILLLIVPKCYVWVNYIPDRFVVWWLIGKLQQHNRVYETIKTKNV